VKLPNRYGSVVKLKGARRNPFAAKKFAGYNEKGHAKYTMVGYFPTREAALTALAQYNKEPWNIEMDRITVEGLYALWLEKRAPKLGKANRSSVAAAWTHCEEIKLYRYKELRACHMQDCIDNCGCGHSTQVNIKNLFYHLDRLALELDLSGKQYSTLLTVVPEAETTRAPFADSEVAALWKLRGDVWADSVLIMLYSGWRISEFLGLELEKVVIEDAEKKLDVMQGGVKTKSGKGRVVPIHSKIFDIVSRYRAKNKKHLFEPKGRRVQPITYYRGWIKVMERIGADHVPHECRHTLRTWLDAAGANKTAIDRIMGHASPGTGERVYTHKTIEDLRKAIELVTN
jgi:hypothetical protein